MPLLKTLKKFTDILFPTQPHGGDNIQHCAFGTCFIESWYEQPEFREDFAVCQGNSQQTQS